jgi:hypothetical protein
MTKEPTLEKFKIISLKANQCQRDLIVRLENYFIICFLVEDSHRQKIVDWIHTISGSNIWQTVSLFTENTWQLDHKWHSFLYFMQ